MARISRDSVESRILDVLKKQYPITVRDIKKLLGINPKIIDRAIMKLVMRRYIELEYLPDKIYVRLLIYEI